MPTSPPPRVLGDDLMNKGLWSGYSNSSVFYVIIGVVLALGINQGLALALSTDMPIVAVESSSMVPAFNKGDMLILQGTPQGQLSVEDIVVFDPPSGGTPIVHRIVSINSDGTFQTKGDANSGQLSYEKSISHSQIHGRVIMIIPYLGWVKIGMTQYLMPNLLWMLLGIAVFGLVYIGGRTFAGPRSQTGGV
jgi:signal peptidase I